MDGIVEQQWRCFWADGGWGEQPEVEVARLVVAEPDRHDWRVVDAALDRITCDDCGGQLSRGPVGCAACDLAHGFRYAAIERDRPGVPRGNEHAVRVNVSVVRRPQVTSENELLARRLLLPVVLVGLLPTISEAQRFSARIKAGVSAEAAAALVDDLVASRSS
ncbi:hypothetical protein [Saccharopolyspora hirsuta]|uniref:hypothetical protein n=1 Tax=Saccharopolyspora hirsuta TaxID=1837 RepID=UPI001FEC3BF6|nr:hypothetical protein [Saccharopolyspora hirsuta]